jgi:hypothetical protein
MPFPRVEIDDRGVVCLIHVPRTGGTTLWELLATRFAPHERRRWTGLDSVDDPGLERIRLLAGDFDTNVAGVLPRPARFVTMLREPASRMKSRYESARRTRQHPLRPALAAGMTFREWLRHPDGGVAEADRAVRQIAGVGHRVAAPGERIDRWGVLEIARERLDGFAFFGILERFDESVRLLADAFGWESFDRVPHLARSATDNHRLRLDARELELVHEMTELDAELYEHATRSFRERAAALTDADLSAYLPGAMYG